VNDCRCADLDVGTRLDASALPASWRHEGSTGHTLQGGDWYGEHGYVCAVCGVRFELVLDGEGGQRLACRLGLGLYDDFEPDLGVPWALPLESFTRE
jgi:hypothetical protein